MSRVTPRHTVVAVAALGALAGGITADASHTAPAFAASAFSWAAPADDSPGLTVDAGFAVAPGLRGRASTYQAYYSEKARLLLTAPQPAAARPGASGPSAARPSASRPGGVASVAVKGHAVGRGLSVVAAASRLAGRPYVYGAAGPRAFDCSGLTLYVYRQFGVYLPHRANDQKRYGHAVSRSAARPGDLIIFLSGSYGYHAGIYAGNGYMWDAPHRGATVGLHKIWSSNVIFRRLV